MYFIYLLILIGEVLVLYLHFNGYYQLLLATLSKIIKIKYEILLNLLFCTDVFIAKIHTKK